VSNFAQTRPMHKSYPRGQAFPRLLAQNQMTKMFELISSSLVCSSLLLHSVAAKQFNDIRPPDQVAFEQSVVELNDLLKDQWSSNNPFRFSKLSVVYQEKYVTVFGSRKVDDNWTCVVEKVVDFYASRNQGYHGFDLEDIGIFCNTPQMKYILLAKRSPAIDERASNLRTGSQMTFHGNFVVDHKFTQKLSVVFGHVAVIRLVIQ